MRICSLLIIASAFAILSTAIPILSPNANSITENNQNLSNDYPNSDHDGPMVNNELPKTQRRPAGRPKRIFTAEEKAARKGKIQEWEVGLQRKSQSNWERYQGGIKRARKRVYDMGKDPDDAELDYRWYKMQRSVRMLQRPEGKKDNLNQQIKKPGPGRPRMEIDPAEIAAWEAEKKGGRGWGRYLEGLKNAEHRAKEDGKNAKEVEEAVARKRQFAFLQSRNRVLRRTELEKKTNINHSESVAVQPAPAGHLQNEDDHTLPEKTSEMPITFDFESDLVSSDEENGGKKSND